MIRVLVIGDRVGRARIVAALAPDDRLEVAAQARGDTALALRHAGPDVVVATLDPEDERASRALLDLAAQPGAPTLVAVTDHDAPAWTAHALRAGVRAVIPRDVDAPTLRAAVAAAAAGLVVLPPELSPPRATAPRSGGQALVGAALTPRELQVLELVSEGLANKAIAARLAISERTVKFHLGAIFEKLDVSSRTEAVTAGLRRGLILL